MGVIKLLSTAAEEHQHQDDVMSLAVIGGHIFSGSYDGEIKKWDAQLKLLHTWRAHHGPVYGLVGHGHLSLFSSSSDGVIRLWDAQDGTMKKEAVLESPANHKSGEVKALCTQGELLVAGDDLGTLAIFSLDLDWQASKLMYTEIWSTSVSPDGLWLFSARDNECIVTDLSVRYSKEIFSSTACVRATFPGRAPVVAVQDRAAIVDRSGMTVEVFSTQHPDAFSRRHRLTGGHDMIINAILMDGEEQVVSAGWDAKVLLWDLKTDKVKAEYQSQGYINALAWLDAKTVVGAGQSGLLFVLLLPQP